MSQPDSSHLVVVDSEQARPDVAEIAASIRDLHRRHTLACVFEIGRLVVEGIYGGELSAARRRGPKDASLSELAGQPDMPMSLAQLSRAVSIYDLLAPLGDVATWQHLSMSHARVVLALPSPRARELLQTAETEGWTVAVLDSQAQALPNGDDGTVRRRGGRPPLPRFHKSIRAMAKYADDGDDLFGDLERVEELKPQDAEVLHRTVVELKRRLDDIQTHLERRLGSPSNTD